MDNQRERAIAIKFDSEEDSAPKVIAMGAGEIARKIKEVARENDVPLYHDSSLVEVLSSVEIGEEIPIEVYEIMARIIAWVYTLDNN